MRMFRIFVLLVPFAIMGLLCKDGFSLEYLRADMATEEEINMIQIISDKDRLREIFNENADDIISFFSDKEDLFSDYALLMIQLAEPSEDIYHEVLKIRGDENTLNIYMRRLIPERISSVPGKDTYLIKIKRQNLIVHDNYSIVFT